MGASKFSCVCHRVGVEMRTIDEIWKDVSFHWKVITIDFFGGHDAKQSSFGVYM